MLVRSSRDNDFNSSRVVTEVPLHAFCKVFCSGLVGVSITETIQSPLSVVVKFRECSPYSQLAEIPLLEGCKGRRFGINSGGFNE